MVLCRRAQQRAVVARRASEKGDSLEEREELQIVQAALLVDVQGVEQAAQDLLRRSEAHATPPPMSDHARTCSARTVSSWSVRLR